MSALCGPNVTTSNLQICIDFKNTRCYSGSGTTFTNLVDPTRNNGFIKNNCSYSDTLGGFVTTNGANNGQQYNVGDRIDINTSGAGVDRFSGLNNFSIFFWVNQISSGRMLSTGSAGSGTGNSDQCIWYMWCDTSQYYWWNSGGGGTNNITAAGTWHTPGTWQMIGFTYSYNESGNNVVRCYTNGVLQFSGSIATASHSYIDRSGDSIMQWTLGGGYSSSCFNTNAAGRFNLFLLYNKALSSDEIYSNFTATRSRYGI